MTKRQQALGDAADKLRADFKRDANTDVHAIEYVTHAPDNIGILDVGKAIIKAAEVASSGIGQRLHGLVQAKQRNGYRNSRRGELNTKKLTQVLMGNTKVFKQREEIEQPNTAFHILVDMSYSMNAGTAGGKARYEVAQESAAAIALAVEPIRGVTTAVTYFDSYVTAVKHRHETVAVKKAAFGSYPKNCTALTEALWFAGYELSKCKENRKVIIIVTDGEPDDEGSCREVTKLCENGGIEIHAIGIGTSSVLRLFKSSVVIQDARDLKSELFKLIEKTIV